MGDAVLPKGDPPLPPGLALAATLAAVLLVHAGLLAGGVPFAGDAGMTFEPLGRIVGAAWSEGPPLWTGRLGGGVPLLANPALGVAWPPDTLFALLDAPRALALLTLLHALAAALGCFELARRVGATADGAMLAGIFAAAAGPTLSATAFPNLAFPLGVLPWLLVAQLAAAESAGSRARLFGRTLACGAGWWGLLVLGEPVMLLAALLCGTALAASRPKPGRSLAIAGAGFLVGLACAAPVLAAQLTYLASSVRAAGFVREGALAWSLHPLAALGLIAPGAERTMPSAVLWPVKSVPLFASLYVGLPMIALAAAALAGRSRRAIALGGASAILVLLALGRWGPLGLLPDSALGALALRFPIKAAVPACVPLAVLAGLGLSRLCASRMLRGALVAGLAAECLVAVAGAGPQALATALRGALPAAIVLGLAWRAPSRAGLLAASLIVADLLVAGRGVAPVVPPRLFEAPIPACRAIAAAGGAGERTWVDTTRAGAAEPLQAPASPEDALRSMRARLVGYTALDCGLSLIPHRDTEAIATLGATAFRVLAEGAPPREQAMLLGAAGVRWAVTFRELDNRWWEPVAELPGPWRRPQRVYRNRLALPRVRWARRAVGVPDDAAFRRAVAAGSAELFADTVLLTGASASFAVERPPAPPGTNQPVIDIRDDRDTMLVVAVDTAQPGWLVVADVLAPGWSVRVDGRPARLLEALRSFRAVGLSPGRHEVEFSYRPL